MSNRTKDEVTVLEGMPKMNVEFERFPTNINIFLYSLLRAIFRIEFECKIKMKLRTYRFLSCQAIKTLN